MTNKNYTLENYSFEQRMEALKSIYSERIKDIELSIEDINNRFIPLIKQHQKELAEMK